MRRLLLKFRLKESDEIVSRTRDENTCWAAKRMIRFSERGETIMG